MKGGREIRENDGRVNLIKIHYKHTNKSHNESLCTTNYANKMSEKQKKIRMAGP
jgi:hypothetical protein